MNDTIKTPLLALALLFFIEVSAQVKVIPVAHSHNDYTRKKPLHDALANGFFSIEIDVFYNNGSFSVAHTVLGIRKKKNLENLYLKTLKSIVQKNNGYVFQHDTTAVLEIMIDTKGAWNEVQLRELEKLLFGYENMFVVYKNDKANNGAIKVLLSGGGYKDLIKNDNPRIFSADAGIADIASELSTDIIARNSSHYKSYFKWKGRGAMPEEEKEKLLEICNQAKQYNRKVRFWACPNNKNVWRELLNAGVGWVNIDKLEKFKNFYWNEYLPYKATTYCCPRF